MGKNFLVSIHPIMTLLEQPMVVNTIRGTVSFLLPVATNFTLAYAAMMRWLIMR